MAGAKTQSLANALEEYENDVIKQRLLRSARLVQNQSRLMGCVEILKAQYGEKRLVTRIQELVTKIVLQQMYGPLWKTIYKKVGLHGGEFVLNVTLPTCVWINDGAIKKLTSIYISLQNGNCDLGRINEFMQKIVNYMTPQNMDDIIKPLTKNRRNLRTEMCGNRIINTIVVDYIPR